MDAIVAVDARWGIGRDGDLLFRISADLRRFKALTMGHTVVMGRRTLQSLPGGRGLPGRRNLVLSRQGDLAPEGAEVYPDMDALLAAAPEDSFVIGGASGYWALLDQCSTAYVTKIEAAFPAAVCDPDRRRRWGGRVLPGACAGAVAHHGAVPVAGGAGSAVSLFDL